MRILIADDDPISRRLLEGTLVRLGHEVVSVADGQAALAAVLAPDGPRLAILDWMMPNGDGLEVCRRARAEAPNYVYVMLLTSRDRREDRMAGLDAGADDFLTKPLDVVELRARLRSGERVVTLQQKLLDIQEALRHEATHDHLTGLWNRRMVIAHLDRERSRAGRNHRPLAVAVADLDHFKEINDRHGHAAGDEVLKAAAARMRSVLRDYDAIGRYGGEEFLIVMPERTVPEALGIAERAREAVCAESIEAGGAQVTVSLTVGLAWSANGDEDGAALIHAADQALYRAKAAGRNRCEVQTLT
jgi:two-component system cell cycle response regulator